MTKVKMGRRNGGPAVEWTGGVKVAVELIVKGMVKVCVPIGFRFPVRVKAGVIGWNVTWVRKAGTTVSATSDVREGTEGSAWKAHPERYGGRMNAVERVRTVRRFSSMRNGYVERKLARRWLLALCGCYSVKLIDTPHGG